MRRLGASDNAINDGGGRDVAERRVPVHRRASRAVMLAVLIPVTDPEDGIAPQLTWFHGGLRLQAGNQSRAGGTLDSRVLPTGVPQRRSCGS